MLDHSGVEGVMRARTGNTRSNDPVDGVVRDRTMTDRQENRWLVSVILVILLITQAPYAVAQWTTPPDRIFSGALLNRLDANSYLATIRQGTEGNWLFNRYTPEPHQPGPLRMFYTRWGRVAAILGDYNPGCDPAWFRVFSTLGSLSTVLF